MSRRIGTVAANFESECRWLADFEADKHKKCVLHKARAKRVEELLKQLQQKAWPDIYRALQLDIGNAYREITEIKFEEGRAHDKVSAQIYFGTGGGYSFPRIVVEDSVHESP